MYMLGHESDGSGTENQTWEADEKYTFLREELGKRAE
jgi:hypothetical protein